MNQFLTFFRFELSTWCRGLMVWIFLVVNTLLIFAAALSDNVQLGGAIGNTYRNAPWVVQSWYGVMSIVCCLMTTAFVNSAACRDFVYNMTGILFSRPVNLNSMLLGRFVGATLISMVPACGVSVGLILASWMPWIESHRWGGTSAGAHIQALLIFAIPNTLLLASVTFGIAVRTRSSLASFLGIIGLLVALGVSNALTGDIDNRTLASLLDPFGTRTFRLETMYWTVAERNTQYLTLTGMMVWNRLLWLSISLAILTWSVRTFSIEERVRKAPQKEESGPVCGAKSVISATTGPAYSGPGTAFRQMISQAAIDFVSIIRSPTFIVIGLFAIVNMGANLSFDATEGFGLRSFPVTYQMIDLIRGSMFLFLLAIITFFAGVLVWKERESRLDEVFDASPHPTWVMYTGKITALTLIVIVFLILGVVSGIVTQALQGYTRFQVMLYITELLGLDLFRLFCLCVMAMACHVVASGKYSGYFLFVLCVIVDSFGRSLLDIQTHLVNFGGMPGYSYSDLYGFAPFSAALRAFAGFWLLFTALLSLGAILLWQRGRDTHWRQRLRSAVSRWCGPIRTISLLFLLLWAMTGTWVFYNTHILNTVRSADQLEQSVVEYEQKFKAIHEGVAQPRTTKVSYVIDLVPERRALTLKGVQTLVNRSEQAIPKLFLNLADGYQTDVGIERAVLEAEYRDLNYRIYQFEPPLQPGESVQMTYTVSYAARGFENELTRPEIVQNGTFFNNLICPQPGYQTQAELRDRNKRKKRGLPEVTGATPLDPSNLAARGRHYVSNNSDWVEVETIISTAPNQTAVAPGSLLRTWETGGRRYFHYKVDHPSLNFYSFISAEYAVAEDEWNGVKTEVYYHPEHAWNVPGMMRSIHKSLEYYSEKFGPYRHRQARIIEFPRVSSFAQAFPGTMPYSESIGFIADIRDEDDIDMVFYVVAHEMAHQWWAHQVVGADMQGATLLSETLAQYSALMVMEREYGRDMMRRFLRYEMDRYLQSRGTESLKEQPLRTVEPNQGYIHYQKGSVVMYQLKEVIGEDRVNAALKHMIDRFAYQQPPYPTSADLIEALEQQTPEQHHGLLRELFDQIVLYSNRTQSATCRPLENGQYEVTLEVECRRYEASPEGVETETPFRGELEIGAFAEPESGRRYGATLYRQRHLLASGLNQITFVVETKPAVAGIDPFLLLVDRVPEDNTRRCVPGDTDSTGRPADSAGGI